jgi:hypothetical protein
VPDYRVNRKAVAKARALIDQGRFDDSTDWSDAAPDADAQNDYIAKHGYDGFAEWHLAEDPDAGEETKKRYAFPYGDLRVVSRQGLIHAKQRASQNDHTEVERAADDLLQRLEKKRGG